MSTDQLRAQFEDLWVRGAPHYAQVWEQVVTRIASSPPSPEDMERIRAKMLAGHLEHDGDVVAWTRAKFREAVQQEADDLLGYALLELVILGPPR